MAKLFAEKFGCKAVAMTFPGRLYLDDPSRDWPGDTIHADGTVRTPIWLTGEHITPDQYEVVRDTSMRLRYGTRTVARAKPGTIFYDRMAAWPVAFEAGMKDAMRRHFPVDDFSIYLTGHSTGGPMVFFISQRVPNVAGMIAVENSPFGFIQEEQHDWSGALGKVAGFERVTKTKATRSDPFNELYIRTWRDRARYAGPEALGQEGPQALMRLPWLMEEILDWWDKTKARPQFKAEYVITHNIRGSLEAAARAAAARLKMSPAETEALVQHYLGFPSADRAGREAGAAGAVLHLQGQPRPQPGSLSRGGAADVRKARPGAEGARHAMGRGRAHLPQVRARPAARHRAAGGGVLRAGDPGGVFRRLRSDSTNWIREYEDSPCVRKSNGPTARKSAPR